MLRHHQISAAFAAAILAFLSLPVLAQVDGESQNPGSTCNGTPGQADMASWDTIFECNSSNHWQRGPYFFGATADTCDSTHEGLTRYDSTAHALYYCNGTAWTQIEPIQSTPVETAPSGSGYFVLSYGTYAANSQSTLAGFDSTCYTDLTTHTGWQGYSTANSNGQLTTTKIHAFVCVSAACNAPMPLTSYYFANSQVSSAGGAYFTTDSSGNGPNDAADWAAANYFGASASYWTGRDQSSSTNTVWGVAGYGLDSNSPAWGMSGYTTLARWVYEWDGNSPYGPSQAFQIICYVNP